jgi:hypothetical protein
MIPACRRRVRGMAWGSVVMREAAIVYSVSIIGEG